MRKNPGLKLCVIVCAAALTVAAGTSTAMADRTPVEASGNSTIQFGGPVLNALQRNGCGPLSATATGTGTVISTGAGKVKVKLPITGFVFADTGAVRIQHAGSGVDLSNACYDVRLTNFYIQDLGGGLHNTAFFDVLAKAKSIDNSGERIMAFRLDVTPATSTLVLRPNSYTVKIRGMDLLLGDDGASEFNELSTGDPNSGPFVSGQLIGKGGTSVRFGF